MGWRGDSGPGAYGAAGIIYRRLASQALPATVLSWINAVVKKTDALDAESHACFS